MLRRNDALTQPNIDSLTDLFENIVLTAAEATVSQTGTPKQRYATRKYKNKKPFGANENRNIHNLRKQFGNLAHLISMYPNNPYIRGRIEVTRKKLCRANKQQVRETKNKLFEKLENLHDDDPNTYWKIIKDLTDQNSSSNSKIPTSMIEKLKTHFENLGRSDRGSGNENFQNRLIQLEKEIRPNETLDSPITENEIKEALHSLKSNKACGPDQITNEMLKFGAHYLITPLRKLFNSVFTSELYPKNWSTSYISALHKNGPKTDPGNYRGISVTSCVGKLYSSILNSRLTTFLDQNRILHDNQSGFRKKRRTAYNLFILKTAINKYVSSMKKTLYLCFVDFSKAFDRVWRDGLLIKLLNHGIGGKFYSSVKQMYHNTISAVKMNNQITSTFKTEIGVKQGDNLSPTLFNIYLNDLQFPEDSCKPIKLSSIPISHLLWADDLLILSETPEGLQKCLDILHAYCIEWKLNINIQKSNVMIVGKGKQTDNSKFHIGDQNLINCNEYKYLGCILNSNGNFTAAKKDLSLKATN